MSFALFVVVLLDVRHRDWDAIVQRRAGIVVVSTTFVAAAITAGAAFWLNHIAQGPDTLALAYVLTSGILVGAVTYLAGTLLASGSIGLRLRWTGWAVLTAPLLVPSTFSLFLPVVAALAVTLRPLPPQRFCRVSRPIARAMPSRRSSLRS